MNNFNSLMYKYTCFEKLNEVYGYHPKTGSFIYHFELHWCGCRLCQSHLYLPHFLSLEHIGLMRLIIEIATLLMLVFQFGSPYLVIRFFPKYVNSEEKQRSFYILALAFSIFGILMMMLFYWAFRVPFLDYFSEKSSLITDYEKAFLAIASSMVIFNVFERIFGSKKS